MDKCIIPKKVYTSRSGSTSKQCEMHGNDYKDNTSLNKQLYLMNVYTNPSTSGTEMRTVQHNASK